MGLWLRWSWLLLVALVYGLGFSSAGEQVLGRDRRQSGEWWRGYQPSEWGSHRGSLVGSSRWEPSRVSGWGPSRFDGGASQSRQLQPTPQDSPIRLICGEDTMVVTVNRDLYGNGRLVKASDLTLGPQNCNPGSQSTATSVVFEVGLQACGNGLQMTPDQLIYKSQLNYSPKSSVGVPITRTNPSLVLIQCYYLRHGNVSSNAIKPTWIPFSTTVTSENRLAFSLHLMTDDWSAPRSSSVFQLGNMFSIEASVDTQNHAPMILFIDSCVATLSPDVTSSPRYEIIASNGCLLDGKLEDASSAFRTPRMQPDKLQFSVDAFRFIDKDVSTIYITCSLRAAPITQAPDPMNKACSYTKSSSSWSALEGSNAICQCCDMGNCDGHSRRLTSAFGRPRGIGKREIASGPSAVEHGLATLGPLLVVGAEPVQPYKMTAESGHVEQGLLVTIVCQSGCYRWLSYSDCKTHLEQKESCNGCREIKCFMELLGLILCLLGTQTIL